jgi:hypothetical protein
MRCPRCQHDNPGDMNFCGECGARLAASCSACSANNPPANRFCGKCGAPVTADGSTGRFASPDSYTPKHLAEKILTSKVALEGERKQVTVLFADLKGSMELLADRDPEEARKILDPVLELRHSSSDVIVLPAGRGSIKVRRSVNDSTGALAIDNLAAFGAVPLKLSPGGTAAKTPGAGRPASAAFSSSLPAPDRR